MSQKQDPIFRVGDYVETTCIWKDHGWDGPMIVVKVFEDGGVRAEHPVMGLGGFSYEDTKHHPINNSPLIRALR